MNEAKGACPFCGGILEQTSKKRYTCNGCGESFSSLGKGSLRAIVTLKTLEITQEKGPLSGSELAKLLLEKYEDMLVPRMTRYSKARGKEGMSESIRSAISAAYYEGLLGKIPRQPTKFCAPDYPDAVVRATKPPEKEAENDAE